MANYYGGSGNDSQTGTIWADSLYGNDGNDTISALAGDDTVYGGAGADSINAGDGADQVYAGTGNDTVTASNGYDRIYGEAGNDNLSGGSDSYDDLYGGSGDDSLYGGSFGENWAYGGEGNDLIYGGAGSADVVRGGVGNDTAYGGNGDDQVVGGTGSDSVLGEAGNDRAIGDDGNDTVDGGTGNDTVEGGQGNDSLVGGDGADVIRGDIRTFSPTTYASGTGGAQTTVTFTNSSALTVKVYFIDSAGVPQIYTTLAPGQSWTANTYVDHNWMLTEATTGASLAVYEGGVAQTNTYVGAFNDTITGGQGADTIYTDYGSDLVYAGTENDMVHGGAGNDTVYGGWGDDNADLGDGNDVFGSWSDDGGNDTVTGGAGDDNIIGGADDDVLYGGSGNDSLFGGAGNDSSYGGQGNDAVGITDDHQQDFYDLGEETGDRDSVWFGNYATTNGVSVTFTGTDAATYAYSGGMASGSFTGAEILGGTAYADTLNAAADTDGVVIYGGGGADSVTGGSGNDEVYSDDGNDTLSGGAGDDTVGAGAGHDSIFYGAGNDIVYGGDGNDVIDDVGGSQLSGAGQIYAGAGDDLAFAGFDNDVAYGGAGNDTLYAEGGDDTLYGEAGDDLMSGDAGSDLFVLGTGAGADRIYGGESAGDADTLRFDAATQGVTVTLTGAEAGSYVSGSGSGSFSEIESVVGSSFADTLLGGAGNDRLSGAAGNDSLSGGAGQDTLSGGSGRDVFQLVEAGGGDTILDFDLGLQGGQTTDRLDVSALRTPAGGSVKVWDVAVSDDGSGNALLTFPEGETLHLQGVSPAQAGAPGMLAAMGVPCFVAGTRIATPQGPRPVEGLQPGDLVSLAAGGAAPVLWRGTRHLTAAALAADDRLRPVRLDHRVHGAARDLLLSPQHGVVVSGPFGRGFARAIHLADLGQGARVARGIRQVTYVHILLPVHSEILAEGLPVESFYPGPMAVQALSAADRASLTARIMSQPQGQGATSLTEAYGQRCLPLLPRRTLALLLERPVQPGRKGNHPKGPIATAGF